MAGLGIEIDKKLAKEFDEFIKGHGYKKFRAIEAALRAYMVMPIELQHNLMSNTKDTRKMLIETFQTLAIQEHLEELSPEQRRHALAVIREGATIIARKKKDR